MKLIQMPSPKVPMSGPAIEALLTRWGSRRTKLGIGYAGSANVSRLQITGHLSQDDGTALIFRDGKPGETALYIAQADIVGFSVFRLVPSVTNQLPASYDAAPRFDGGVIVYEAAFRDGSEVTFVELEDTGEGVLLV